MDLVQWAAVLECRATMMKAMNINFKKGGDDLFINRLFSYLNYEIGIKTESIQSLRGNVFLVQTAENYFLLKGFSDLRKLKTQQAFTSSLRRTGFDQSYCFLTFGESPLYLQNQFFGCLEYINPHPRHFHYSDQTDRQEGALLLETFHDKTAELARSYANLLPRTDLMSKWKGRKKEFTSHLAKVHYFINKEITREYLNIANLSLQGYTSQKKKFEDEAPVILHGDVAHHNFLRSEDEKLYLIDYDLISIGPRAFDMLQYANRILPFLEWRMDALAEVKYVKRWLSNKAFLYALLFPADIFREWNRLLRERDSVNPYRAAPIAEMTTGQFNQRQRFWKDVKSLLKE